MDSNIRGSSPLSSTLLIRTSLLQQTKEFYYVRLVERREDLIIIDVAGIEAPGAEIVRIKATGDLVMNNSSVPVRRYMVDFENELAEYFISAMRECRLFQNLLFGNGQITLCKKIVADTGDGCDMIEIGHTIYMVLISNLVEAIVVGCELEVPGTEAVRIEIGETVNRRHTKTQNCKVIFEDESSADYYFEVFAMREVLNNWNWKKIITLYNIAEEAKWMNDGGFLSCSVIGNT